MSNEAFTYDVLLSHSAKDKAVVRPLAERLQQDGLNPKAEGRNGTSAFSIHPSAFPCRSIKGFPGAMALARHPLLWIQAFQDASTLAQCGA